MWTLCTQAVVALFPAYPVFVLWFTLFTEAEERQKAVKAWKHLQSALNQVDVRWIIKTSRDFFFAL